MTLFQIIILLFFVYIILRVWVRYIRHELTVRECIIWSLFWIFSGILIGFMRKTDVLAQKFGIERGADLFIALSIVFGYYMMFRVFVHIERLDQDITKVVRKIALNEHAKK